MLTSCWRALGAAVIVTFLLTGCSTPDVPDYAAKPIAAKKPTPKSPESVDYALSPLPHGELLVSTLKTWHSHSEAALYLVNPLSGQARALDLPAPLEERLSNAWCSPIALDGNSFWVELTWMEPFSYRLSSFGHYDGEGHLLSVQAQRPAGLKWISEEEFKAAPAYGKEEDIRKAYSHGFWVKHNNTRLWVKAPDFVPG